MLEAFKSKTPSLTSIVGMVVAVIVALLIYGGWQYLWPALGIGKLKATDLSGVLVFSAKPLEDTKTLSSYSLAITNGGMEKVNESERFGFFSTSMVEFATADTRKDFFFRALANDSSSGTSTIVKQVLHAYPPDGLDVLAQESWEQYGTMSWSPLNKMLARAVVTEDLSPSEKVSTLNWKVVITNEAGEVQTEISDAANPVWMPGSTVLLFVRSDGIYAYDVESEAELRIISLSDNTQQLTSASIGTMFEVSPDGSRLVLTTPGLGNISLYEVSATMDVKKLYSHNNKSVNYSWPIVSPDGKTFVVLTKDITDQGLGNPRIEFYAMDDSNFKSITSYPLNDYDPGLIYLDDWVK